MTSVVTRLRNTAVSVAGTQRVDVGHLPGSAWGRGYLWDSFHLLTVTYSQVLIWMNLKNVVFSPFKIVLWERHQDVFCVALGAE